MNMPPPMNITAINDSIMIIHHAYQSQPQVSMQSAATEIREFHLEEEFTESSVVVSGLLIVISVDNVKWIDVEIMTKIWKSCEEMEKKEDAEGYAIF